MNVKGNEDHDEVERKSDSELGDGDKKNVPIVSLIHCKETAP